MNRPVFRTLLALLASQFAIGLTAYDAQAASVLSLASAPLTTSSSSTVKPNLLFVLDNSGSMGWDYTPDYVPSSNCFDSKDDGDSSFDSCDVGDPPYMSSDFNTQYYNPAVTYSPGVDATGTAYASQDSGTTTGWTSVRTDMYNKYNKDMLGNTNNYANLLSGFPDRVWCTAQSDAASGANCVKNSSYSYPNSTYGYGLTTGGNVKYVYANPYYYIIGVGEYCSDANLTTCISSTVASGSYIYPAKIRWCNSSALTTCQAKRIGSYTYPRYSNTTVTGTTATGTITIGDSGSTSSVTISNVTVNGVAIINSAATAASGTNTSTNRNSLASTLASRINSYVSTPDYTASASGAVVTISAASAGTASNGYNIVVTAPSTSPSSATGTLTVSSASSGSTVTQVTANGTNLFCPGYTTAAAGSAGSSTRKNTLAAAIASNINNCTGTSGYSASVSSAVVTITAPAALGAGINGQSASTTTGAGTVSITAGAFANGKNATNIPTTVVNMNGGGNASSTFSRVDIVPGTTSYTKAASRTDCAGATCTYAEEMTNFANWFTYYRTRMQMMKSAAGRAFTGIGSNFRVGFVTINSASSNYLKIGDYDATQKGSWYTKLYGISPSGSTPLRTALTTAGRIFAGKNPLSASGGDDPMQYSCQQNFTLLTTDGYWNDPSESSVVQINGSTQVNNQDNDSSTMPRPMYDGNGSALSCPSGGTCLGAGGAGSNGSSSYSSVNTLADAAAYYYNTDLRTSALGNCTSPSTSADVCANNVPGGGNDTNSQQHMTTFTLGLGIDGSLTYQSDYASATSGDYYQISQGTKDWPQAKHDDPTAIDDLWHAAVNGRGVYFSARDPNTLSSGLNSALSGVSARLGSGAAAATSNLEPVAGDNYAYVASYTTVQWYGNLESRTVDTQTGVVSPQAVWCVEDVVADPSTGATACTGVLKTQVGTASDTRNIYTFSAGGANKLRSFTWGNLTATEQGYFSTALLSQYSTWSASDKTAATGTTLINYLRGQTGYENQTGATAPLYRDRQKTLGDVVGSQPVYVKKPYFSYSDPGYTDYVTAKTSRAATVYIGANDGMLHAFNAESGAERWAYIPTPLLPSLYKLADANYSSLHQFYTDGPVVVGDICTSSCDSSSASWKTILIGGLNGGGRGYYALDITDPTAPAALWELTTSVDTDIGYSYGNPIITKDSTGKWVVLLTSGYNNVSPGSGNGILFVIDAATGSIIRKVNTGNGGSSAPAGLAKIAGWASNPASDNSVTYAYGGDLDGNLWRFDPNAGVAVKIAALTSSGGTAQPITSRPELTDIAGTKMVFVATGKLLETTDLSSTGSNSIYGIKDVFDTSGTLTSPHSTLVQQTLTNGTNASGAAIRTGSSNAVNLSTDRGWYIDLPDSGERSNIDMQLVAGSLLVPTNVPSTSVCYAAGYGWLNYLDYKTGGFQSNATNGYAGTKAGNALIVGMVVMKLATGFVVNATLSDNPTPVKMTNISVGGGSTGLTGKRSSWRELP